MNNPIRTILVVDDSTNDLLMTQMGLTELVPPPVVVATHDGSEALDFLHRRGEFRRGPHGLPHLILLDLKMPRIDGLEVLRQIKSDPELKRIPTIMFTSSREDEDVSRCYQLGANAYVVKPVDFQAFLSAIKQIGAFWAAINEVPADLAVRNHADDTRETTVA